MVKIGPQKISLTKTFLGLKRPLLSEKFRLRRFRNSGKTKTTGITAISRLPSYPRFVKFGSGPFEL